LDTSIDKVNAKIYYFSNEDILDKPDYFHPTSYIFFLILRELIEYQFYTFVQNDKKSLL